MTQGTGNESGPDHAGLQQMDDLETEAVIVPDSKASTPSMPSTALEASRQPTGDDAVDDVLAQLDATTDQPLDSQIQVGEQVHRVLQGRLADLGKE
jgi:hypothetical protein